MRDGIHPKKQGTCCGNCIWHIHNGTDWVCSCEDAEAYGLETEYTDTCSEFLDRDLAREGEGNGEL